MMRAALGFAATAVAVVYFLGVLPAREVETVEGPAASAAAVVAPKPAPPAPKPVVAAKPVPAPADDFVVRRVLDTGGPIKFGTWFWDDKDVPAGRIVITVDLKAQTLSVFRGGYEIGAAAILYGDEGKETPLGTFPITEKDADHVSNLYHAPMPYMLRLTNDGISIHGSEVEWGYATHGCVGVPVKFAKLLFGVAGLGDKVIITSGRMIGMGEAITH
ncbi:MAG: L,D-transpeptidase family protein [Pseudomonadota bacterium]